MNIARRALLRAGTGALLSAAAPGLLSAIAAPIAAPALLKGTGARRLAVQNIHTGERLAADYFANGRFEPQALEAFNRVLRDHRTGDIHAMEPGLLDLLHTLNQKMEGSAPYQVISGYRSPHTNGILHGKSSGVATKSLHLQGMAMDVRLPGRPLARLYQAALSLQLGGVGYYPTSDFVHVDVGRVRRWSGA